MKPRYAFALALFLGLAIGAAGTNVEMAELKQLATGVDDVFINGTQVLKDGKHTGAKPGRFVRGPGWTGWPDGGACR